MLPDRVMRRFCYGGCCKCNCRKFLAQYVGQTEDYHAINCPPVTIWRGKTYLIEIDEHNALGAWDIVRIYDTNGRYLTWVPYSVSWRHFWVER